MVCGSGNPRRLPRAPGRRRARGSSGSGAGSGTERNEAGSTPASSVPTMLPMRTPFTTSTSSTPRRCSSAAPPAGSSKNRWAAARARAPVQHVRPQVRSHPLDHADPAGGRDERPERHPVGQDARVAGRMLVDPVEHGDRLTAVRSQPCRAGPAVAPTATAGTTTSAASATTGIHPRPPAAARAPPRPAEPPPGRARAGRSRTRGRSRTGPGSGCGSGTRTGRRPRGASRGAGRDDARGARSPREAGSTTTAATRRRSASQTSHVGAFFTWWRLGEVVRDRLGAHTSDRAGRRVAHRALSSDAVGSTPGPNEA